MVDTLPDKARKGRGAVANPDGRFEAQTRVRVDDGWGTSTAECEEPPPLATTVSIDATRTIIARNQSPDIPFAQSINPYRGCEHGCIYCFARPTHAYLGLSPGLDFETKLFAKPDAAALLAAELRKPGYRAERHRDRHQHRSLSADRARAEDHARRCSRCSPPSSIPFSIVTKSALVVRDLDIIAPMAAQAAGQGVHLGDHARPRPRAHAGAARRDAAARGSRRSRRSPRPACRPAS